MVDLHLLANGEIELIVDELFSEMPGEGRVPLDSRQRTGAKALVCLLVLIADTYRECRHTVEAKVGSVVVVDKDRNVRLNEFMQPTLYWRVAIEQGLPVRLIEFP